MNRANRTRTPPVFIQPIAHLFRRRVLDDPFDSPVSHYESDAPPENTAVSAERSCCPSPSLSASVKTASTAS